MSRQCGAHSRHINILKFQYFIITYIRMVIKIRFKEIQFQTRELVLAVKHRLRTSVNMPLLNGLEFHGCSHPVHRREIPERILNWHLSD